MGFPTGRLYGEGVTGAPCRMTSPMRTLAVYRLPGRLVWNDMTQGYGLLVAAVSPRVGLADLAGAWVQGRGHDRPVRAGLELAAPGQENAAVRLNGRLARNSS